MLAVEADRRRANGCAGTSPPIRRSSQRIDVLDARVARLTDAATGAVSLDELAYREGGFVPDLVKMDVEGNEVAALRGAQRLLAERKPHVIIETHSEDLDAGCRWLLEDTDTRVADRRASPLAARGADPRVQPLVRRAGPARAVVSGQPDFGRLAADYDRVRPVDDNWHEVFELVVRAEATSAAGACSTAAAARVG